MDIEKAKQAHKLIVVLQHLYRLREAFGNDLRQRKHLVGCGFIDIDDDTTISHLQEAVGNEIKLIEDKIGKM